MTENKHGCASLLDNPKRLNDANLVLESHGFTIISDWINNNEYAKDGLIYGLNYPVWDNEKVRIYNKA